MRKVQDIESRGRCRIERKEEGSGYRELGRFRMVRVEEGVGKRGKRKVQETG